MKNKILTFTTFFISIFITTSYALSPAITQKEKIDIQKIITEVNQLEKDAINDLNGAALPFPITRSLVESSRLASANCSPSPTSHKVALSAVCTATVIGMFPLDTLLLAVWPFIASGNLIQKVGIKHHLWATRYQSTNELLHAILENKHNESKSFQKIKKNVTKDLTNPIYDEDIILALKSKFNPIDKSSIYLSEAEKHTENYWRITGSKHPLDYEYNFPIGIKAISSFITKALCSNDNPLVKKSRLNQLRSKL